MIATLAVQSSTMPVTHSSNTSPRNANSAGAPLPLIPRRSVSASRVQSSNSRSPTPSFTPVKVTLKQASPPLPEKVKTTVKDSDGSSSSSSASSSTANVKKPGASRPKRRRALKSLFQDLPSSPEASSAPHDASRPSLSHPKVVDKLDEQSSVNASPISSSTLIHQPGTPLKITLEKLKLSFPTTEPSRDELPPVIRKKSGQLLKSSLKASTPAVRGGLSVVTGLVASKSEPVTPKAVHFDAHLEHVKLFLAEQRPLAVSRDGSPTDDTSGTDSDFPPHLFGESDDNKKTRKRLEMKVVNMPAVVDQKANVALTELKLAQDWLNIVGKIRVRNIAFQKWLAVRFTFDAWQTTSKVAGKHVESVGDFDIFSFTIRLDDLAARIEGKTLILAIRYSVAGQEFWDNNKGHNYLANFSRTTIPPPVPVPDNALSPVPTGATKIDDLRRRLEKVIRNQEREDVAPREVSPSRPKDSLSSRYSFNTSFKEPLSPTTLNVPNHTRTMSTPTESSRRDLLSPPPSLARSFMQRTMVQPKTTLGSPRDIDDEAFRRIPFITSDPEDAPFRVPATRVARNHQRGYFDLELPTPSSPHALKRTPPGLPRIRSTDDLSPPVRFNSFPPMRLAAAAPSAEPSGSDISTPSILSPSASSRSTTPSPTEGMVPDLAARIRSRPSDDGQSYSEFLNKFCFYTGNDSSSSATSSPDTTHKPSPVPSPIPTPPLQETLDDPTRSGSATPTLSFYFDIPEISTPVML